MELMACESMKTVIPVYYDTVLKNKYARDERSIEMLDLIYENRICDLGDTFWSNQSATACSPANLRPTTAICKAR